MKPRIAGGSGALPRTAGGSGSDSTLLTFSMTVSIDGCQKRDHLVGVYIEIVLTTIDRRKRMHAQR